jgi:hypothetical protein
MDNKIVATFPVRGLSQSHAHDEQPAQTSIELMNCWAFDMHGRLRGSQRPGVTLLWLGDVAAALRSSGTVESSASASSETAPPGSGATTSGTTSGGESLATEESIETSSAVGSSGTFQTMSTQEE